MQKGKIVFVGNFWEFFLFSIVLLILAVITLGLALPYCAYWSFKYFFCNMEIELYEASTLDVGPDSRPGLSARTLGHFEES